ncbi:MAG: methionine gamma-lyase family protein [Candidatus Sericytochromatia bacterium]|nr:methionine gamma-lyase family protein [Candidatus Sericytochromatia bacterium]
MTRPTELIAAAEAALAPVWAALDATAHHNTAKVLDAFQAARIGDHHFAGTTGYGHDDLGRGALEAVFADVFRCEAALVRGQFASGTHAIATALFGVLRPGDELLAVTGHPYDTLEEVIGLRGEGQGSLADWGVTYREVPLGADGRPDLAAVRAAIGPATRVCAIQRSRGYAWRPSVGMDDMAELIAAIREAKSEVVVFVDNCYGEFTETREPTEVGADLVAGSLIKNPGAGIVPSGGYVAGRADLVHACACRFTAPGIGAAGGASLDQNRLLFQGLFMAPHTVCEALKGATLAARVFAGLGYDVSPTWDAPRTDIIQAVRFGAPERLVAFCRAIQAASPINAYVTPIPDVVPGYEDDVVMAGGTFIEGSTIELSADGPLRPPYVGYWQGGLSYSHCRIALARVLAALGAGLTADVAPA